MSVDLIPDLYGGTLDMVRKGLKYDEDWPKDKSLTFGFFYNKKPIGGLVFHDLRRHTDVWLTIYSIDKHWCTRRVLRLIFAMAFLQMDCKRVTILVRKGNRQSLDLVHRLGFKDEGVLRRYWENGDDCHILGMLRSECPWINFNGDKKDE